MAFPHNISGSSLGLGMVFITMVISWVACIFVGGFKFGALKKTVKLVLPTAESSLFLERFERRLREIGFVPGATAGHYLQSGSVHGDLTTFTHAKTKKLLTILVTDRNLQEVSIELTAKY